MAARPVEHYTVALQGFSEFERSTLASFFRLAVRRTPSYSQVADIERCDFVIADADHAVSLDAVRGARRQDDTVFVGAHPPQGAMAWLRRPIDPVHILRELDAMVEQHRSPADPLAIARPEASPARGSAATRVVPQAPTGPDVLVAEDSAIARRFLELRLQRLGYRVHLATDGQAVLSTLKQMPFALIFLDVVLGPPGSLDGLQICQQLKQHPRFSGPGGPKILLVTSLASAVDRVRGALAGCDAYLTKPLLDAEFMHALHTLDPGLAFRQRRPAG
jgi:CheY-like chemotaxis protein